MFQVSSRPFRRAVLAALVCCVLTLLASPTLAQTPTTTNIPAALAPLDRNVPVELVALTLDATLTEQNGHMLVAGTSTYKLHNTDPLKEYQVVAGFPTWVGGTMVFDPDRMDKFQVFVDDKRVQVTRGPGLGPLKLGAESRTVDWYSWTIPFTYDQKRLVRVEFAQDLGENKFPRFVFGTLAAEGWKGNVGSMRLSVGMPGPTTMEQFLAFDPFTPDFDGQTITWHATNFNPQSNESMIFVRPSDWAALLGKRAAVAQRPEDPNAHYVLAQGYQEMASIPSSRGDSFRALALAELEITTRLDPKNVNAREQLAQLYETRAGPAGGARDANYIALAMQQWQGLVGSRSDADARRHLAEDTFYLALDARKRGDYEQALKLFGDVQNYAPGGAGPLYTVDRLNAERKSARLGWARLLAEKGDLATALVQAREATGAALALPAVPPFPILVLTRAQVTTNSVERLIELRLVALPNDAPETDQAFSGIVAALSRANTATVTSARASVERVISLRVPYSSASELQGRLRSLADALGDREDLAAARAIILPTSLEIGVSRETWTDRVRYHEQIDLTNARRVRQARLDALAQAQGTLDKAKPDDDMAQLQRAFLNYIRGWVQSAYAGGAAKVEFVTSDNARQEWTLNLNDSRDLALEHEIPRLDVITMTGAAGLALVVGLLLLVWVLSRLFRRRQEPLDESGEEA